MRYTRLSCMPFRAAVEFDRAVLAESREDAVRQACLCIDRDLEEILSRVSAINVSEVLVEVRDVTALGAASSPDLWNPEPFPADREVPRHILLG